MRKKDNTRTFVLEDERSPEHNIAYYILTMTSVNLGSLPEKFKKKHKNMQAAGLISRLAFDKQYVGQGYGEWILIDALKKLLAASKSVVFPLIIVDANDGVVGFYEKFGFTAFFDTTNKLFISIADVRASLQLK